MLDRKILRPDKNPPRLASDANAVKNKPMRARTLPLPDNTVSRAIQPRLSRIPMPKITLYKKIPKTFGLEFA